MGESKYSLQLSIHMLRLQQANHRTIYLITLYKHYNIYSMTVYTAGSDGRLDRAAAKMPTFLTYKTDCSGNIKLNVHLHCPHVR